MARSTSWTSGASNGTALQALTTHRGRFYNKRHATTPMPARQPALIGRPPAIGGPVQVGIALSVIATEMLLRADSNPHGVVATATLDGLFDSVR